MKTAWLALAALVAGCDGGHSQPHADHGDDHDHDDGHGHGHGHGHGEEAVGITRWTETLELFAEHPPAITGQPLPFLAHLTILDGFRALKDAKVTLVLQGSQAVEASVDSMLRPGIFQPTFDHAPAPGTYAARLRVVGPGVSDTIDGFSIVVYADAAQAKAASGGETAGAQAISFLKEQQWEVPFATAFAERAELVPALEVAGEITTPPAGQAELGAPLTGRVVAPPQGLPRPGQAVRRGELLLSLAPAPASPESGARASLMVVEAEARLQAARAALARAERLIADRAIPQRGVDDARRELRVAEEAVVAARRASDVFSGAASGQGGGIYKLTAPIDGVVVSVSATAGRSVQSGEVLLRIVDLSELWVRARVPELDATRIRENRDAALRLPGLETWLPLAVDGDSPNASVVNVGRVVDPVSRTVDILYALAEPDPRLRVGAHIRVAVPAGEPWQGVIVPRDAVLDDAGRSLVYVQVEGEAFEERSVRVAVVSGASVGLAEGVAAGERVVTLGANVVRLSSRASAAPAHGHVH